MSKIAEIERFTASEVLRREAAEPRRATADAVPRAHLWRDLSRSPSRLPRIKSGVAPRDDGFGLLISGQALRRACLQGLAAHEARLSKARRDAFTHHRAPQRPDAIKHVEAEPAHALRRQKVAEQRAVEEVDRGGTAPDIGAPPPVVFVDEPGAADIGAVAARRDRKLADGRGVAQAEIEALGADRRDDVTGLADERDAAGREAARGLGAEAKGAVAGVHRDLAGDRMAAPLDFQVERRRLEALDTLGFVRVNDANEARPRARQRHQRERAMRRVELGLDIAVPPRMAEIEGQRGLRIAAAVGLDAGGGTANRAAAVGRHDEPGRHATAPRERP